MTNLRDHLLDAYGSCADKRIKGGPLDRPIRVDDKSPRDDHPFFCAMSVRVPDPEGNALILAVQRCPAGPEVLETVEKLGGSARPMESGLAVVLPLKSSQGPALRRLARSIRSIVDRASDDPDLRSIHLRAAASLEELAEHLDLYQEKRFPEDAPRPYDPILARRRWVHIPTSRANLKFDSGGRDTGGAASR